MSDEVQVINIIRTVNVGSKYVNPFSIWKLRYVRRQKLVLSSGERHSWPKQLITSLGCFWLLVQIAMLVFHHLLGLPVCSVIILLSIRVLFGMLFYALS